jgi:DNA ligase-1
MNVDDWDGQGTLPLLYSRTAKGAINEWLCWVEGPDVRVRWGQQDGQQQEARFTCEPKNVGRANSTTAEQQAVSEAIAKWKKQVKKKYHWDTGHVTTERNLKPMLAKDFKKEEKKVEYPVYVQPKFDGVRCMAFRKDGAVHLMSRGGDPYVVNHILAQLSAVLPEGIILDGELYHHGTSLQTILSWVRRPQEDSINIVYMVYDMFIEDAPDRTFDSRFLVEYEMNVSKLLRGPCPHVCTVQTAVAKDRGEVKHYHNHFVQLGYEGAIIRLRHGQYRFGFRSSELLKLKEFQDAEFEIVGYARGKGKFYNVPTLTCKMPNSDKTFDATPKGTEAERLELLRRAESGELIGKMFTVRFFDYTDDGLPHYPVGVAVREEGS